MDVQSSRILFKMYLLSEEQSMAVYEADIDFRLKNDIRIHSPANKENKQTIRKEMMKPVKSIVLPSGLSIAAEPATETEFTEYFA